MAFVIYEFYHPSTLVVKNTDILVGLHPPPVSLAALGFIHIMAEVFRSCDNGKHFYFVLYVSLFTSHQILVVVSPIVRKFFG